MNLFKSKHWMAIAIGLLSGPALAATISCPITPAYSIITEGQTLQLAAGCDGGELASIEWKMDGVSVTGAVSLTGYAAGDPINYTTPVGLGDTKETQEFVFTVVGIPKTPSTDTFVASTSARVVVKPSSAVLAVAKYGTLANTSKTPGECGSADGTAVTTMPTGTAQCATGSAPALPISGPQSFTWSCLSLTGGAEASCYAMRGFTVTATHGAGGTISPASQPVTAGDTASFTAAPASGYSAAISGCGGTQSGNNFTTGPVTANCTVTASFTNSPQAAACGSANGVATLAAPSTGLCATGTLLGSVASGTGQFTWTCDGPNGGADASCVAPKQYTVTAALSGTGGTVNTPTSKTVTHNATTSFTVTPEGTNVASASGCGASVSGNTVTTGAITGACAVTVSFGPAETGISCNGVTMPGTVTEIDTALPASVFPRTTYSSAPVDTVYSYKITVPAGTAKDFFSTKVIKTTSAPGSRYMVISSCKGDYITANKAAGCYRMPSETTTATATINYTATEAPATKYCDLKPGQTYWVNLSTRNSATGTPMCNSPTECGFYFEAN